MLTAEQPPVDHGRGIRLDRHPFRGDGVLMSVPEDHRSVGERRVEAGDDVVTPRMNGLSRPWQARRCETVDQIIADPPFEVFRPRDVAPHRIDARPTDEVGKRDGHVIGPWKRGPCPGDEHVCLRPAWYD
jgi:hypothetical protein